MKKIFLLFPVFLLLTACATIIDGKTQTVHIDSNPIGAKVFVGVEGGTEMREAGITPLDVTIMRKDGLIVLKKEGYNNTTVELKRRVNGLILLDVTATSPLSTSIDISTGAINEYDPGKYLVTLSKAEINNQ